MQKADRGDTKDKDVTRVPGDPGVGGLLSDPLSTPEPHEEPDSRAEPPSPSPAPPRHHGDWMPTKKEASKSETRTRSAFLARRRSRSGMPYALFREGDGTDLDYLRGLRDFPVSP